MHWIKEVLLNMLSDSAYSAEMKEETFQKIRQIEVLSSNPEISLNSVSIDINHIGYWLILLLLDFAEDCYGDSVLKTEQMWLTPVFEDIQCSKVAVNLVSEEYPEEKHGIFLSRQANTWHQYFYEIAHEVVHMLCPVDSNKQKIATLEEGVAVKFAECMYQKYVFPLTSLRVPISPLHAPPNLYLSAYLEASKIPDPVLKEVRERHKGFYSIENPSFYSIVKDYITKEGADLLCVPFKYR